MLKVLSNVFLYQLRRSMFYVVFEFFCIKSVIFRIYEIFQGSKYLVLVSLEISFVWEGFLEEHYSKCNKESQCEEVSYFTCIKPSICIA